ncbi:MAG: hypothetical protein MUO31_06945 [Thermodesulfovibrionales bacterium]|nr:hypothetical protein [Thermodesulfovibrionales bacterium]
MPNKLNGNAKWIGLGILIITNVAAIAYNVGVTNTRIAHLTEEVVLMRADIKDLRNMIGIIPAAKIFAETPK